MRGPKAILVAVAMLPVAPAAEAKEYGATGTLELGGALNAGRTTQDFEDNTEGSRTFVRVSPMVGLFLLPGIQLVATGEWANESETFPGDEGSSEARHVGLGAGGAILLPFGKARLGPQLLLHGNKVEIETKVGDETVDVEGTGPGASLSGVVKLPIGSGGILEGALVFRSDLLEYESGGSSVKSSRTSIGTRVGVSLYF